MSQPPALSVVIVTLGGEGDLERCLAALRGQTLDGGLEILAPWIGEPPALARRFPEVRWISTPAGASPAAMRAAGVRQATAPVVALTEDHCIPSPGWSTAILHAHAGDCVAAGGCIEKDTPDSALNWAVYLADYLRYAAPRAEGPAAHLSDCNVSYKRAALERIAVVWREEFHENMVHAALRQTGQSLWFAPSIEVRQRRSFRPHGVLGDRRAFGRLFAATRARQVHAYARLVLLGSTIALPALLTARVAAHALSKRRHGVALLRAAPWLVVLSTAWAVGEFLGYLTKRPPATLPRGGPR